MGLINPHEIAASLSGSARGENLTCANTIMDGIVNDIILADPETVNKVHEGIYPKTLLETEIRSYLQHRGLFVDDLSGAVRRISDAIFGYGELQPYIDDSEVSDILVNDYRTVYIKKFGAKRRVPVDFGSEENLRKYCYRLAALCGGRLDESSNAEKILSDRIRAFRIVISLKPVSVLSPTICIRKPTTGFTLSELVSRGLLTSAESEQLKDHVLNRRTIIIAGRGGSGKTTLLGALIDTVPGTERGILIQETYEIKPRHPDIVSKLIHISDTPGIKDYTLFELTRNALLMSVDRIFIGELKDRETMDFFNAIYTGHRGSMATVHANSASEVVNRLILLMKRSGTDIPVSDLREMLLASLDVVVYMDDYRVVDIQKIRG